MLDDFTRRGDTSGRVKIKVAYQCQPLTIFSKIWDFVVDENVRSYKIMLRNV